MATFDLLPVESAQTVDSAQTPNSQLKKGFSSQIAPTLLPMVKLDLFQEGTGNEFLTWNLFYGSVIGIPLTTACLTGFSIYTWPLFLILLSLPCFVLMHVVRCENFIILQDLRSSFCSYSTTEKYS